MLVKQDGMAYLEELGLALTGGAGLIVLAGIFRDYHYGNEGEDEADGQHQHIWFPQPVGVSHIILLPETKPLQTKSCLNPGRVPARPPREHQLTMGRIIHRCLTGASRLGRVSKAIRAKNSH